MSTSKRSSRQILPTASSNTVVWEGKDLPCINLCTGDTVSDIVYKLAVELCALKAAYDLKDLDLKCIFQACLSCPTPVKTLENVLELIINKVCAINTIVNSLNTSTGTADEVLVTLASCFLPQVDSNGDPVTKLPHSAYTRLIATMVCSLKTTQTSHGIRIDILEADVANILTLINGLGQLPKVSMTCVAPNPTPIDIDDALVLLETQFCQLRAVLGLPAALTVAIGKQPSTLAASIQLGSSGTMSSITGWKSTVSTVADSETNLWLTVIDIRGAVKAIQDNCCKVTCDSVIVDFDVRLNDERTIMTLFFANKSKIPVGFADCNALGNLLNITDSNGATHSVRIKVAEEAIDFVGFEIDLGATPIDPRLDYTLNMEACMTNGSLTCQKCVTKTLTYKDTCAYCEISVTDGVDPLGYLVVVYED